MSRYLLDASVLYGVLRNRPWIVDRIGFAVVSDQARTSILVYGEVVEMLVGLRNRERIEADFEELLVRVPPHPVTRSEMDRYAALRRTLRPPYGPGLIGDIDTLIAATAIEHGMTLVTMDRDFERVPGLELLLVPRR